MFILELILSWPKTTPPHMARRQRTTLPTRFVLPDYLACHDHPQPVLYMVLLRSTQGKQLLSSLVSLILHCLRTSITVGGTSFNSEVVSLQEFLHPPLLFSGPAVSSSISRPTVMCKSSSPIAWLSFSNNIIFFISRAHLNLFIDCEINFVRFLNSWSIC